MHTTREIDDLAELRTTEKTTFVGLKTALTVTVKTKILGVPVTPDSITSVTVDIFGDFES